MNPSSKKILITTFAVWAFVVGLIHILAHLPPSQGWLSQILGSLTTVALIYPPILISIFQKKPLTYVDMNGKAFRDGIKFFLLASVAIFPLSFLINHFYQTLFAGTHYAPHDLKHFATYIFVQIFLVGLPEEFFFRGYLQENLKQVFPTQKRFLGAPFGFAQILTAAVFALSHSLITVAWWHSLIFFPALVFGWLKEKTGAIWAGTLFHAACNAFSYWVLWHYS